MPHKIFAVLRTKTLRSILIFFLVMFLYSCSSSPRFTNEKNLPIPEKVERDSIQEKYNELNKPIQSITGPASFYSDKFNGKVTANGETYKMYGLTAAHNSFPFNTIIRVTNLKNNKSIVVRVNDRMPLHPERIVDLSYGAAILLDMVKDGVVDVRLDILEWGKN
jgi:rare lipoprotein A